MEKNELRQKIVSRLNALGIGPIEAASRVEGLERNYIRDFLEDKKQSFTSAKMPLVAQALGWSLDELQGNRRRPAGARSPQITMVPLLEPASVDGLAHPGAHIPLDGVPLLAFADLGDGEFFAIEVDDDTMDRYSPKGSIIAVDKIDRELVSGHCYVFSVKGGAPIYRMWRDGKNPFLVPYSTNPSNQPILFDHRSIKIIGRVKRTQFAF